jgi:RNA polymerase sigma factor (sigma-70 family)
MTARPRAGALTMGRGESGVLSHEIRILFEMGTVGGMTDGQLLEQFAARPDKTGEAAFAMLVARHGPMVLGVCRGLLGDAHDAEDSFQAAFLVLARKARSIRNPDLLGTWLYGVARRTAQKAKARRARRKDRADGEGDMSSVALAENRAELEPMLREQNSVLHQEVDRLPQSLRAPIVLCYLEGLTHDEAAHRLRWPIGTVRCRMARARSLLRSRLTRRGLAYAALAAALDSPRAVMAEVPHTLAEQTARSAIRLAAGAAPGLVSTPVATLMEEVVKAMLMNQLKRTTTAVLAAACLATGAGVIAVRASQHRPSRPHENSSAAQTADRQGEEAKRNVPATTQAANPAATMTVSGRVLEPSGKPAAGARVAVLGFYRRRKSGADNSDRVQALGRATTDGAGRFRVVVPRTSSAEFFGVDVIAGAAGFGAGWRQLNPDAEAPETEIRLGTEQVVLGRFVDVQGQPAAGVAVSVISLEAGSEGQSSVVGFYETAPANLAPWPTTVTTDDRGRFLLHGVARGVRVQLQIRDERFTRQDLSIGPDEAGQPEGKLFALNPPHLIEGRVTYRDTGRPVPHARLVAQGGHWMSGEADAEGRFRLNPYCDTPYRSMTTGEPLFTVYAHAPYGEPYLGVETELTWTKGTVRQSVDFALPRGVLVRGRIKDAASGKPVGGAQVLYAPMNVEKVDSPLAVLTGEWSAVASQDDGNYAIPVLPGTGHLVVTKASPEYILSEYGSQVLGGRVGGARHYAQALIRFEARKGNEPAEVPITLRRGVIVTGQVIGPDGQPVAEGVITTCFNVSAQAHRWGGDAIDVRDGRFVLPGLDTGRKYRLLVRDAKHRIGAVVELSPRPTGNEPLVIRLAPCGSVRFRLLDSAGKPVAGYPAALQVVVTPGRFQCDFDGNVRGEDLAADAGTPSGYMNYLGGPPTDQAGWGTFTGLIPAASYRLLTTERGQISLESEVLKDFQVEPGQTLEIPALSIK